MLGAGFDIGWKYFDGLGFSGGCEVLPGGWNVGFVVIFTCNEDDSLK